MNIIRKIEVFGDSILKGIQINPLNKRYYVDNNIGIDMLSKEFSLEIVNNSRLGCTVTKGKTMLDRFLGKKPDCTAILMDYGGNDCDFNWKAISENPDSHHEPYTPIKTFMRSYSDIINNIFNNGIRPIVTNLPPICPNRYFNWLSKNLDKKNILQWLEDINLIYRYQESYSRAVEKVAKNTGAMLVDLRSVFLSERHLGRYLCEDGIHPNTEGQKLITQGFVEFCKLMPATA
jgi:lysophospholipase L1-like esterase